MTSSCRRLGGVYLEAARGAGLALKDDGPALRTCESPQLDRGKQSTLGSSLGCCGALGSPECRLTAYEFSGNTRANARVLSAATRG